jgi:hypothetical protein
MNLTETGLQAGFRHALAITLCAARVPGQIYVTDEPDIAVSIRSQLRGEIEGALHVIGVYGIIFASFPFPEHVISKHCKWNLPVPQCVEHVCRIGSPKNHRSHNTALGKDSGEMEFLRRRAGGIPERHKQKLAILRGAIGFGAEQNTRLKVMQKIAIRQHECNNIGLIVALLIEVHAQRLGSFSNPGAYASVYIYLAFGYTRDGSRTHICSSGYIFERFFLHAYADPSESSSQSGCAEIVVFPAE